MPAIKMTTTLLGSNDGIAVETFEDGREYVVSNDLAANFIGQGAAVPVQESKVETTANPSQPPAGPTENKVVAPAETKPAKRAAKGGA